MIGLPYGRTSRIHADPMSIFERLLIFSLYSCEIVIRKVIIKNFHIC